MKSSGLSHQFKEESGHDGALPPFIERNFDASTMA
jgi:hypothetical protein